MTVINIDGHILRLGLYRLDRNSYLHSVWLNDSQMFVSDNPAEAELVFRNIRRGLEAKKK